MQGIGPESDKNLEEALDRAVARGTLLRTEFTNENGAETYYFINSPKGQAAVRAITLGDWRPSGDVHHPLSLDLERPNIYRLYEENIGPLTPMIRDELIDAETQYPADWIENAMRIAVENNVRRWRYVQAILRSWQEEGRDEQNRGDTQKDRRRYIEGPLADFIEH
jgi:DnaD/phage-associated family protein